MDILQNIDQIVSWFLKEDMMTKNESDRIIRSSNTIGTLFLEGSEINNDVVYTHEAIKKYSRLWEEQTKEEEEYQRWKIEQ